MNPKEIIMNINEDGTYRVEYRGVTMTDENDCVHECNVVIPRAEMEFEYYSSLPVLSNMTIKEMIPAIESRTLVDFTVMD